MNPPYPPWPCLRLEGKGPQPKVILDLSVSPNAKRTELVGWHDGALRVRLSAPPVDGAANEALRKWLASELACLRHASRCCAAPAVGASNGPSTRRKPM